MEVPIGEGTEGYDNIVSTFEKYSKSCYARCVLVNPLHSSMPKLIVCATATCNKFDNQWVRDHWIQLKSFWDEYCRADVGPLIGHASDGDARRRKLMLADYRGRNGLDRRYDVGWEGWQYSIAILPNGDLYGFGDQDQPHNGKKLINPMDRVSSPLVLGDQSVSLSYVCNVYNHYRFDEHGLNWDDVNRSDRQNWAGPQRIASRKVQACLKDLHERIDVRHERSLGTEVYLCICADYIDIFFSKKHDLRSRIVLASKVSWFFRLWRLWLHYGDHSVGGNVGKYTEKAMISVQAFHDVNASCHFIVLLICAFRDKWPYLEIPFHLLGSDCCEIFFSKVGGMSGHERNYDFGSLLDSAVGLNRIAGYEYGPESLKVGRSHKKQEFLWGKLHPLADGEVGPNLGDYSDVANNELVVVALKEGLTAAKELLTQLQMSPNSGLPAAKRKWWTRPWEVEALMWPDDVVLGEASGCNDAEDDVDHGAVVGPRPTESADTCDEVDDPEADLDQIDEWIQEDNEAHDARIRGADDGDMEDDPNFVEVATLGHEVRHIFGAAMGEAIGGPTRVKVDPFVMYEGKPIYKSTLVSQLVGNPHLSKDRLTRIKQVQYASSGKRKFGDTNPNVCLIDVGSDVGVVFEAESDEGPSTRAALAAAAAKKGKGRGKRVVVYNKEYWLGRIVMIRRKYGSQWGRCRTPIDLMDRPRPPSGSTASICQIMCNWYKPTSRAKTQFTYNTTDLQWIDIDNVIASVTLSMRQGIGRTYVLHDQDKEALERYLADVSQ